MKGVLGAGAGNSGAGAGGAGATGLGRTGWLGTDVRGVNRRGVGHGMPDAPGWARGALPSLVWIVVLRDSAAQRAPLMCWLRRLLWRGRSTLHGRRGHERARGRHLRRALVRLLNWSEGRCGWAGGRQVGGCCASRLGFMNGFGLARECPRNGYADRERCRRNEQVTGDRRTHDPRRERRGSVRNSTERWARPVRGS